MSFIVPQNDSPFAHRQAQQLLRNSMNQNENVPKHFTLLGLPQQMFRVQKNG